jgi:hypothetical protein
MNCIFLRHARLITGHQRRNDLAERDLVAFDAVVAAQPITA